jgi:FMN-dependent NADH-azoreductase
MANMLHVAASPLGGGSRSNEVALELVDAYRNLHPGREVATVDVWNVDLPDFDRAMIAAKFAVLRSHDATDEQQAQWARAVELSQLFNQADSYLFSVPMWNFGVPYRLKHYIDVITLPGQNWSWTRSHGYRPLLQDKRAVLVYSSAGDYPVAPAGKAGSEEFQKPFMRKWLEFIGVEVVGEIVVGPTLADADELAALLAHCKQRARTAAQVL